MGSPDKKLKIVVLTGPNSHSQIIVNFLLTVADVYNIRIEDDFRRMNENRLKRYGLIKGVGQKFFIKFSKKLKTYSKKRIDEIIDEFNMDDSITPPDLKIPDVNDERLIKTIHLQQPDMILLNCASLIPQNVLDAVEIPFINMHGGITPMYRGVFGGYWALRDGNEHLIGSTVHLVDAGIDTGEILKQVYFSVNPADNFSSYNTLHLAYALKGLHEVIDYYIDHERLPEPIKRDLPSKLRSHPTIYGYLFYRLFKGIK